MKTFRLLTLAVIALLAGGFLQSCGDDDDGPRTNTTYSDNPVNFPRTLLVESIEKTNSYGRTERILFSYDDKNRIIEMKNITNYSSGRENEECVTYTWDGSVCTAHKDGSSVYYKGYFTDGLLKKAEWENYTITNVTFEGRHLVKGSNGYTVTWDGNGNITAYSDCNHTYDYTSHPNKANYDFNEFTWCLLDDSWDDDGSKRFAYFGLTGIRTTNLMAHCYRRYSGDDYSYTLSASYTFDSMDRVSEVDVYEQKVYDTEPAGGQPEPELEYHYVIKYVEN